MKLLGSRGSPYVRKVRIAFVEKNILYEYVVARPSDPNSGVAEFNPLGKVPVLVRLDGTALYDSSVIVEYLDRLSKTGKLMPDAFADRIEVRRWEALGNGIADATILTSHDYDKRQTPQWHAKQQKKIAGGLAAMESDLGARQFCCGNGFTLADIACGMALGYLDHVLPDFEWRSAHPALRAHAERLGERESFKTTMPVAS